MKRWSGVLNFVGGSLLSILLVSQFSFRERKEDASQQWIAPAIPSSLSFAGEAVPMERWDVREKFDKEYLLNYYSPGTILYLMKLANRNFPVISERLKANGVPDDFKYLCIAESNMQSWAKSSAGAVGYWQFLSGTASGYGLETNAQVDQRKDLARSTDAACKYFRQAYAKFGNWTAAAASFNCGQGGYNAQAKFQKTRNYYDLLLPEETSKYIFRILTFKYLMEHSAELGFTVHEDDKYPSIPVRTIAVSSSIPDLVSFAAGYGTSYKVLCTLNPWLKGRSLSVSKGKTYYISIPLQETAERNK